MTSYNGNDSFSGGMIYDLQDLVKGGIDGASNEPLEALFDRTQWLKNRLWTYDGIQNIAASVVIDNSIIGKIINANASTSNIVITLDVLANFPLGFVLPIQATCTGVKNVTIQAATNQNIFLNSSYIANTIYMHDGEVLYLMRNSGYWSVIASKGNFENVGNCIIGYTQQSGTVLRNGALLNRSDFPRLWKWVNEKLSYGQQVVADSTWFSQVNNIPAYQGCFSQGNGSTTFRVPDDRGCFDRYLDLNRGFDLSRIQNYPGGYEADAIGKHSHAMFANTKSGSKGPGTTDYIPWSSNSDNGNQDYDMCKTTVTATLGRTGDSGGNETIVKNNAKLPLLIF